MRTRLMWALLVLTAVFSMHGLNCAATQQAPAGASAHGSMMAMGPGESMPTGSGMTAPTALVPASGEHVGMIGTAAVGHAGGSSTGQKSTAQSVLADAFMSCLAALACAVAVVLAGLAIRLARRRRLALVAHARSLLRVAVDRDRPLLLVPQFGRLCVLRI